MIVFLMLSTNVSLYIVEYFTSKLLAYWVCYAAYIKGRLNGILFFKRSQIFNSFGEKIMYQVNPIFFSVWKLHVIMNIIKLSHFIGPNSLQFWLLCNMLAVISITFISFKILLNNILWNIKKKNAFVYNLLVNELYTCMPCSYR